MRPKRRLIRPLIVLEIEAPVDSRFTGCTFYERNSVSEMLGANISEQPQCGFSRATIQILGLQGVDPSKFASYNVLEDQELRQGERLLAKQTKSGIKEYSDWPTIPQLYVNSKFIGGCDILVGMHQSGDLEQVLDEAGVLVPAQATSEKQNS